MCARARTGVTQRTNSKLSRVGNDAGSKTSIKYQQSTKKQKQQQQQQQQQQRIHFSHQPNIKPRSER